MPKMIHVNLPVKDLAVAISADTGSSTAELEA